MPDIWNVPGLGFGDLWAALQYCLRISEREQRPVHVCSLYEDQGPKDISARLHEMLALIDAGNARIVTTPSPPTRSMSLDCFGADYFPCTVRWRPTTALRIGYQFDGRSSAELKNPPPADLAAFHDFLDHSDWEGVRIGLPMTVAECATALASCRTFVGVCSGMAVLAHSVGTPVHVLEYGINVSWWHGRNPITVCHGIDQFLRRIPWA